MAAAASSPTCSSRVTASSSSTSSRRSDLADAERVDLRCARKSAAPDVGGVSGGGLRDGLAQIGVAADKLRRPIKQAQHIVCDEDLPVAAGRSADADGERLHLLRDLVGEIACHALDDDGKRASFIGCARFGEHALAFGLGAPLGLEAAIDVGGLRAQADMADNG